MRLEPAAFAALATGGPSAYRIAADWLLERGDSRGEFILDELALFERPNPSTRKAILARRERRTRDQFREWEAPLRALGAVEFSYRWGFVERVRLPEKALTELPKLLELEPITQLCVGMEDGATLAAAMRSPAFAQIRALELRGQRDPVLNVRLPQIESLALRVPGRTIDRVCEQFPGLKRLYVNGGWNGSAAVEAVASGRLAVTELFVPRRRVSPESVEALARSSAPLQVLGLAFNDLRARTTRALGASQTLRSLRELDLRGRRVESRGFLSNGLPALKKLRVRYPSIEDRRLYASRGISLN